MAQQSSRFERTQKIAYKLWPVTRFHPMDPSFFYVLAALGLTVYGHVMIKARILAHAATVAADDRGAFLFTMFFDPWVISGFVAAVAAAASWMLALRDAELTFLFPFMALTFVFVPLLAHLLLGEKINALQITGFLLIVGGISLATIAR
jgi:drug/metabolite transporter (DMT)-like permease